jgi:hypothetical protein
VLWFPELQLERDRKMPRFRHRYVCALCERCALCNTVLLLSSVLSLVSGKQRLGNIVMGNSLDMMVACNNINPT